MQAVSEITSVEFATVTHIAMSFNYRCERQQNGIAHVFAALSYEEQVYDILNVRTDSTLTEQKSVVALMRRRNSGAASTDVEGCGFAVGGVVV